MEKMTAARGSDVSRNNGVIPAKAGIHLLIPGIVNPETRVSKIVPAEAQLANHRGTQTGSNLLAAILHYGEALIIVQGDMASPTASGINVHRDTTVALDVSNPLDEVSAFHMTRR